MLECHQAGKKCLRDSQGEGCVGSLTPPQCLGDKTTPGGRLQGSAEGAIHGKGEWGGQATTSRTGAWLTSIGLKWPILVRSRDKAESL